MLSPDDDDAHKDNRHDDLACGVPWLTDLKHGNYGLKPGNVL